MLRDRQFKRLCTKFSDDIFRFSLALLGNRSDAEEATQDVLFKLWQQVGLLPLRNPRAWIFRTTRNQCLDVLRARARRREWLHTGSAPLAEQPDDFLPHPSNQADADDLRHELEQALGRLTEIQRSIFILYEVNGLRHQDIARILDIPLSRAKVYLGRARAKLQKTLIEDSSWIRQYIN